MNHVYTPPKEPTYTFHESVVDKFGKTMIKFEIRRDDHAIVVVYEDPDGFPARRAVVENELRRYLSHIPYPHGETSK